MAVDPDDNLKPENDAERRAAEALQRLLDAPDGELLETDVLDGLGNEAANELLQGLGTLRRIDDALTAGTTMPTLGDYRLLSEIGRGAMGVVYEAEQLSLGRRVALKVLRKDGLIDETRVQRFRNEARAAAGLQHNHIVTVHAFGTEHDVHYYVMPLIDGISLRRVLEGERAARDGACGPHIAMAQRLLGSSRPQPGGDTSIHRTGAGSEARNMRSIAQIALQAARAVDHAHVAGVLHRDLKPANLLIEPNGHVWVTDFGLAHFTREPSDLTASGEVLGTLAYSSPEQIAGQRVDERSDVYSLGVTLFELATQRRPFGSEADRAQLMRKVLYDAPPRPRSLNRAIPQDLATIIDKAMQKEPRHRYASAGALADDLQAFCDGRPIAARPVTSIGKLLRWARRKPAMAIAIAGATLLLLLAVTASVIAYGIASQRDRALRAESRLAVLAARTEADNLRRSARPGRRRAALDAMRRAITAVPAAAFEPEQERELLAELRAEALDTLALQSVVLRPVPTTADLRATSPDGSVRVVRREHEVAVVASDDGRVLANRAVETTPDFRCRFSADGEWLLAEDGPQPHALVWHWRTGRTPDLPDAVELRSVHQGGDVTALGLQDGRIAVGHLGASAWRLLPTSADEIPGKDRSDGARVAMRPDIVRISADGRRLAVIQRGWRGVDVYDLHDREPARRFVPASQQVLSGAWRPDGGLLALGGHARRIELRSPTGERIGPTLYGHSESIDYVAWSPRGDLLFSNGWDHQLHVWDVASGNAISHFPHHTRKVEPNPAATGAAAAARLYDADGQAIDLVHADSQTHATLEFRGRRTWLHPDGRTLVACTRGSLRFYDTATRKELDGPRIPQRHPGRSTSASLTWLDANRFATTDETSGKIFSFDRRGSHLELREIGTLSFQCWNCNQVTCSANGERLVTSNPWHVTLHDPETYQPLGRIAHKTTVAEILHVSPDGRWATFDMHGGDRLDVLDLERRKIVHTLEDIYLGVRCCFSPDSRWLVISTRRETVVVATGTWQVLHRIPTDNTHKSTPRFLPNGQGLLLSDVRDRVRLLSTTGNWDELLRLRAKPLADVFSLNCSADGTTVVGSAEDEIFVWRLDAMRQQMAELGL